MLPNYRDASTRRPMTRSGAAAWRDPSRPQPARIPGNDCRALPQVAVQPTLLRHRRILTLQTGCGRSRSGRECQRQLESDLRPGVSRSAASPRKPPFTLRMKYARAAHRPPGAMTAPPADDCRHSTLCSRSRFEKARAESHVCLPIRRLRSCDPTRGQCWSHAQASAVGLGARAVDRKEQPPDIRGCGGNQR